MRASSAWPFPPRGLDGEVLPPGPPDPEEESPGWEAWEQAALEFLIR